MLEMNNNIEHINIFNNIIHKYSNLVTLKHYFYKIKGRYLKLNNNWISYTRTSDKTTWDISCFDKYNITNIEEVMYYINWLQSIFGKTETNDKFQFRHFLSIMKDNNLPLWETYKIGGMFSFKIQIYNGYKVWKNLILMMCGNSDVFLNKENLIGATFTIKRDVIIKLWYNCDKVNNISHLFNKNDLDYNYISKFLNLNTIQYTKIEHNK
tara:strand:+ start:1190 stop:1819 length:630 start_codon:yes stop_codon:yes gene_type:complete